MSCNEFAFQTTSTDRAHLSEEVHQGTRTWPLLSRHLQELVGVAGQRHDRSVAWACDEGNGGSTRLRPRRLPSPATMSRRLDGVGVGLLCRCLQERLRGDGLPALVAMLDGKPLTVSGVRKDPEACWGHGAGGKAKGYKLHAVWSGRPLPQAWEVTPMNTCEKAVTRRLIPQLNSGG